MIVKKINIEEIPFGNFEAQVLLADGSVRGELFNTDENGNEVGERQKSVVFVEPWPFKLTATEKAEISPAPIPSPEV